MKKLKEEDPPQWKGGVIQVEDTEFVVIRADDVR